MLPVRVPGHRFYLGTDGTGGNCNYTTNLRARSVGPYAEDTFVAHPTSQVRLHPDERSEMNESTRRVVDQCRAQGMSVLTKEEFESAFLFAADARRRYLTHFCVHNDLELIVDAEAGRFFFLPAKSDGGACRRLPA